VVDDRAAGRKDGRVIYRTHNLDVLGLRDLGEVTRTGANQRPLAQPRGLGGDPIKKLATPRG
jgi:hypothetical protein